ncbi:BlaI/MecI/CopY family transcriptional regulator [Cyclobacterium qasimii]|uniref:Transcriptional regulator, MecI family n=2 Tax=Cyclobacterium qasimii TaxID=1350429 RepID=S7X4U1_9BACT|nr:BlaI/MecI/CopY family transcriptional regulator [Cyclobacterium qasimii]EPR71098.1 Transcriptional regulator, MecI family [Cyclobacterium qasimii M12-11B]GEO21627.1 transcriptional regulator [Cyclobacterium qasimii]
MQLPKKEEQLMEFIWKQEKVFMKDLIESYPDPKPATTTIATLLKRLQDKDFVAYKVFGNSREYYPLVEKGDYFSKHVKGMIKNYFDNSPLQFASFFTTATNLTTAELEDLKKIVDQEIKRKEK